MSLMVPTRLTDVLQLPFSREITIILVLLHLLPAVYPVPLGLTNALRSSVSSISAISYPNGIAPVPTTPTTPPLPWKH
jgi:hypothetical protein